MSLLDAASATYTAPTTPNIARLRALTRNTLRITVTDGRVFLGQFAGTDKPLNILLVNAEEYRAQKTTGDDAQLGQPPQYDGRFVGQVMIPWKIVTKAEAEGREGIPMRGVQTISRGPMDSTMYL